MANVTRASGASPLHVVAIVLLALSTVSCATNVRKAPLTSAPAAPPIVVAEGEQLLGAYTGEGSQVAAFRGIPFAAPPVGNLRWKPPAPITPRKGVQRATEYPPACVQTANNAGFYRNIARTLGGDPKEIAEHTFMSEDCLYLNVWTDNIGGRKPLPVMVWIHGGANAAGDAAMPQTDGASLARKGVVVVSIQYRLNVFGFLAHPALTAESGHGSSGNYGLLDQIAALQWVQRNIAAFGGDPARVTLFGQSAGGTNITFLMSSPLAQGLFHRAVIESAGYAVNDFRPLSEAESVGKSLVESLGPGQSKDALVSMRATPAQDLFRAWAAIKVLNTNAPNVDGWVLPAPPAKAFEQGKHHHVPLLIGFNTDEWKALRFLFPKPTVESLRQGIGFFYGPVAQRALALYRAADDAEAEEVADRLWTDWLYACPSRFIADRMTRAGEKVWFYIFSRSVKAPGGEQLGAYHSAEIPYVWDTLDSETWVPRQPWDRELADAMSTAWVRFAVTGDPNGGRLPNWPVFRLGEDSYLEFGDTIRSGSGIRKDYCAVYDDLQALRIANGR